MPKFIRFIPVAIALTLSVWSFLDYFQHSSQQVGVFRITSMHYQSTVFLGMILSLIGFGFQMIHLRWGIYFLTFCFMGVMVTDLIGFTQSQFFFSMGFLRIEMLPLALLILHVSINHDVFDFRRKRENTERVKGTSHALSESTLSFFERKFKSKTKDELAEIIQNEKGIYVAEAVEAAKRLLKD
jgi:hypothetical protein